MIPSSLLFEKCCGEIDASYKHLAHKLSWRFLTSPKATFSKSSRIALITLNPGGAHPHPEHPRESSEPGSAYVVEQWGIHPVGNAPLQLQIRGLFAELARRLGASSGDDLLSTSLSSHFVPFRSPSWGALPKQQESIDFSVGLWSRILAHLSPRLLVTIDRITYKALVRILETGLKVHPAHASYPVGWGKCTADICKFSTEPRGITIVRFPHLSRYKIFGRAQSAEYLMHLFDEIEKGLE